MPRRSQQDRSRATKAALIQAGRELFAAHGYANVAAEQIVSAAGVTRGALHHHFGDKRGLFVAVVEEVEAQVTAEVAEPLGTDDPLAGMAMGLNAFLQICQRPDVVQLTMKDAPAVLGWQEWREMEARHGLGVIADVLRRAVDLGVVTPVPIAATAQLLQSAVVEAGMIIAHAEDKAAATAEVQQSLLLLIGGLVEADLKAG